MVVNKMLWGRKMFREASGHMKHSKVVQNVVFSTQAAHLGDAVVHAGLAVVPAGLGLGAGLGVLGPPLLQGLQHVPGGLGARCRGRGARRWGHSRWAKRGAGLMS